jgi:hypothetical protein
MRPLRAAPNGLVTTQQLLDRKFTKSDIDTMVKWAWLIRLHRGVYMVPAPDVLSRAAMSAVGENSELVLESALAHLDLRPRVLGPVHVNRVASGGPAKRGGRIQVHRARIPDEDITEVRGLRTTTPTRTLLDVARRQPRYAIFRALEQADRMRMYLDCSRLSHAARLTQPLELFDHYGACTRSDAEAMFLFICEDHGLVRPLVNHALAGRVPDFHWPQERLVVEVDGYEFHDGLPAFQDDRRRGGRFRRAGYEVIRFSAQDVVNEPAEIAETVLAARANLARQ